MCPRGRQSNGSCSLLDSSSFLTDEFVKRIGLILCMPRASYLCVCVFGYMCVCVSVYTCPSGRQTLTLGVFLMLSILLLESGFLTEPVASQRATEIPPVPSAGVLGMFLAFTLVLGIKLGSLMLCD